MKTELNSWLRKYGPPLFQERAMLCDIGGWEKDPFIVFTSEQPGLVAAREILEDDPGTIAWLNPTEFEDWNQIQPDKDYKWHVHRWSFLPRWTRKPRKRRSFTPWLRASPIGCTRRERCVAHFLVVAAITFGNGMDVNPFYCRSALTNGFHECPILPIPVADEN
jgi:hypothetical protein